MYLSKGLITGLIAILPLVSSFAIDLEKRASDVVVTLSSAGGSVVKASIKNNAKETLKFLKSGTFLDSAPVDKATVFKDGAPVAFKGVLKRIQTAELSEEVFATLAPGATLENTFELAAVTDLSAGGAFEVVAEGAVPLASAGSTELSGSELNFRSNKLSITVDGAAAARVAPAVHILDDRTVVTSCGGSQGTALSTALANSQRLSNAAATAAQSGSAAKFQEYFKTTTTSARNTVAARFRGVATQSGSTTNGGTRYYCGDPYGYCSSNVLAYTLPSQNIIANCPIYYSNLPALTSQCHRQDQATTTLHEFTHAPATYSPGTQDNGYGYAAATALSSSQAINNADSYALFANAIYVGC
ncbi:MAG: hypothetical protein L6R38_003953 [Xanthoria sp. 2 TBL-2021]|nr:MAG: hypothetical protein L6R38_003953 [Xanthoria sp. 2 TBL-2021]